MAEEQGFESIIDKRQYKLKAINGVARRGWHARERCFHKIRFL